MTPDNQSSVALEERDERVLAAIEAYPEAYKGFALEACKIARRLASRQQGGAVAWMTADGQRTITAATKAYNEASGGASKSSTENFTIPVDTAPPALPAPALPVADEYLLCSSCEKKFGIDHLVPIEQIRSEHAAVWEALGNFMRVTRMMKQNFDKMREGLPLDEKALLQSFENFGFALGLSETIPGHEKQYEERS